MTTHDVYACFLYFVCTPARSRVENTCLDGELIFFFFVAAVGMFHQKPVGLT